MHTTLYPLLPFSFAPFPPSNYAILPSSTILLIPHSTQPFKPPPPSSQVFASNDVSGINRFGWSTEWRARSFAAKLQESNYFLLTFFIDYPLTHATLSLLCPPFTVC